MINRENLQKLATFLAHGELPNDVKFDMGRFSDDDHCFGRGTTCGTAGCAVGFAPFAGIRKRDGESWVQYSFRTLISLPNHRKWHWCFTPEWDVVDNTPRGAAKRIQYFLRHPDLKKWDGEYDDDAVELYKNVRVPKNGGRILKAANERNAAKRIYENT